MTKRKTVEFEEGWADELMEDLDMTQEEIDALVRGITELVATGEIFEEGIRVEDLPEEEQEEILQMLDRKEKRTRH
jgi:ParB-like chromosome segregation protein Spo0J